jgi:DNA-binding Lrp family transcriptional regulator
MVRAYVMIQTEVGQTARVAVRVAAVDGVGSAVAVTGPYDVIATVEAESIDDLGKMIVSRIQSVEGITRTSHVRSSISDGSDPSNFLTSRGKARMVIGSARRVVCR